MFYFDNLFLVGDESILAQVSPKLVDLQRQGMMLNAELSSEKEVLQQSIKAILDLRNDVALKCAEVSFKCCSEVAVKCAELSGWSRPSKKSFVQSQNLLLT